ncbi:MAG: hypothetical protein CEE38_10520 [Planctomycetes bacterium B3_Pla]|nr:MAG: hypothetical protein CEE38_10520 [Planctomycetes bacterium B3_Pla]
MEKAEEQNDPGNMTFEQFVKRPPELAVLTDHPLTAEDTKETFADDPFNFRYKLGPVFDILRDTSTKTPAAILISGGWGTGKTSAMKWLEYLLKEWNEKLDKCEVEKKPDEELIKVRPVWFYPWKYDNKDDVRRGLIAEVILNAMTKEATSKDVVEAFKTAAIFVGKSVLDFASATEINLGPVKVSGSCLRNVKKNLKNAVFPEKQYLQPYEQIIKDWVKKSLGKDERMVIFIDDLDRCMPDIALMALESIKLYLNIPNLVFVLGVDKDVIQKLVVEHYRKLGLVRKKEKDETADEKRERLQEERKARQYLSKMFQVEIELSPSQKQIADFFEQQIKDLIVWDEHLGKKDDQHQNYRDLFEGLILKFARRNPRDLIRQLNNALMAGVGTEMIVVKQDDDEPTFQQGLQLYFIREILREGYTLISDMINTDSGRRFFKHWSDLAIEYKYISEEYKYAESASDEEPTGKRSLLTDRLSKMDDAYLQEDYLQLLSNLDLRALMEIPFSRKLAEFTSLSPLVITPEPADAVAVAEGVNVVITDKRHASKDYIIVRDAVARQLNKSPDELTDDDYKNIRFLNISGTGVSDLNLLVKLTGLTQFDLSDTSVSDLLPLEALKSLQMLKLSNTQIKDIEPLKNLKKLERLNVSGTAVENIHPLADLESLTLLGLADTRVSDLQPIRNLKKLNWLDIRNTQVIDLEPIAGLSSLRSLFISGAKVSSLEHLLNLKGLLIISVSTGQYRDLSFLANLPSLHELILVGGEVDNLAGIQQGQNIEALEFADTKVANLQLLQGLPRLRRLSFTRTRVNDIAFLKTLTNLEALTLFDTDLTDEQVAELQKALPELEILR